MRKSPCLRSARPTWTGEPRLQTAPVVSKPKDHPVTEALRVGVAGRHRRHQAVRILARQDNAGATVQARAGDGRIRAGQAKDFDIDLSRYAWFDDPIDLARSSDVDCVVEPVGGSDGPAKSVVETALAAAHVVTANKALLANTASHSRRPRSERRRPRLRGVMAGGRLRSSRPCGRRSQATPFRGLTASSTAPATTSSRAWNSPAHLRVPPRGRAAPRLRGSRSDLRRRRI